MWGSQYGVFWVRSLGCSTRRVLYGVWVWTVWCCGCVVFRREEKSGEEVVRVLGHPGRFQEEENILEFDALLESLEG